MNNFDSSCFCYTVCFSFIARYERLLFFFERGMLYKNRSLWSGKECRNFHGYNKLRIWFKIVLLCEVEYCTEEVLRAIVLMVVCPAFYSMIYITLRNQVDHQEQMTNIDLWYPKQNHWCSNIVWIVFLLTLAYLLICTLLNGCLSEFPARQIIYSAGCLAYGNSRNRSSYQTVL